MQRWIIFLLTVLSVDGFLAGPGRRIRTFDTSKFSGVSTTSPETSTEKPCFWKPKGVKSRWRQRININDLTIGQKLTGACIVDELLDGKTGPKVFLECGVGRTNSFGTWNIVNGMLRLNREKVSALKKRVARLRKKEEIDVYVSRIQPGCGRLEVCMDPEDVEKYRCDTKVPVTSLKAGQEVKGKVVKLLPYGAMIDVGANRLGLLHIQKVADLYGQYIDKEKGLENSGIERGAKLRLAVESIQQRRLMLDFTNDVKNEAAEVAEVTVQESKQPEPAKQAQTEGPQMSAEELAAWAAYASQDEGITMEKKENKVAEEDDDEDDVDDYDDYDEERDIEDQLGLGFY